MNKTNPKRFIRLPVVKDRVGYGHTSIYEKIKTGEFPKPYPLSKNGRAVGWYEEEIEAWIASRIAQREEHNEPS